MVWTDGRAVACSALPVSHSHRHSKKRLFRFLSNDKFDPLSTQAKMMPHIIRAARIKGLTPIMIDWSDLGRGFNGLFAAVCFRRRGLPLLNWVARPEELNPSQNRLEEMFIRRLVTHLPVTVRPLIVADRGFGRASLLLFLQRLPALSGYPVEYIVRLKGDAIVQSGEFRGKRMQPEQYFKDGKQRFDMDSTTVTTSGRLGRLLLGVAIACVALILVGMRASASFRRKVCSWGRLGVLHLGLEYYLAMLNPPLKYFGIPHPQSGYA